jgi:vacuolar-type H+-ATPase subunit D/Vma8
VSGDPSNKKCDFLSHIIINYDSGGSQQNVRVSRCRNLQLFKQKIIAAKKGHELLKRKADALKAKFRKIMDALLKSKKKMGEECQQALFLFAEAKYAAGDFQ